MIERAMVNGSRLHRSTFLRIEVDESPYSTHATIKGSVLDEQVLHLLVRYTGLQATTCSRSQHTIIYHQRVHIGNRLVRSVHANRLR